MVVVHAQQQRYALLRFRNTSHTSMRNTFNTIDHSCGSDAGLCWQAQRPRVTSGALPHVQLLETRRVRLRMQTAERLMFQSALAELVHKSSFTYAQPLRTLRSESTTYGGSCATGQIAD